MRPRQFLLKRLIDLLAATTLLFLFAPLLLVTAIMIKLDSHGPLIFSDKRFGKGGRIFKCLKLRTMFVDNEPILEAYLADHPRARRHWEIYRKLPDDPRVTGLGRLLRKAALDELPQLVNVAMGDMSLVGPRPFMLREWGELEPHATEVLSVRPGLLGTWLAHGRSERTFEDRTQLELEYVRTRSLWQDIIILCKSLIPLLTGRGAG